MEFTGERLVPGKVDADLWAEHYSRYLFAEPLVAGRRVLDLGAGAGYGAQLLARTAHATVALDVSREALRYAAANHGAPALSHVAADAVSLPFADGAFDVVVSFELIEHLAEHDALLREVRRVLAPDGTFVVSTPNRRYYTEERGERNAFHVRELDTQEFMDLLRGTFPRVSIHLENHAPAVVIEAAPGEHQYAMNGARLAQSSVATRDEALATAHYVVAVCGDAASAIPVAFFPHGTGNVLRERERHIRATQEELRAARAAFDELRQDWERRGAWASSLDAELRRSQEDYERLVAELDRSREALRDADGELRRLRRGPLKRAAHRALPFVTAGAAVPIAAGVGAAAIVAEAIGRALPPWREPQNLLPFDPTLATILILNYDGKDLLARNLPSLLAAVDRSGRPHQVLIVDNGSNDGSADLVREKFPSVDLLRLRRNFFFSGGNNRGLARVRHDIVVLLNNDMRVEPDFLEPLLRPFQSDRSVFAVASRILMPGDRQDETGLTRGRFVCGQIEFRHDAVTDDMPTTVPILWAGGGACAFDRRKFFTLGGLDVLYDPFYCEDSDLSLRAWMHGWRVLFAPESKVWHDHRTTSRRVFGERFVNETVRRNTLLLHWANLRDPDLLGRHIAALPRIAYRHARDHGFSGVQSLARAVARAPRAVARRLRERSEGPTLRTVLERTDAGVDPTVRRRPKLQREGPLRVSFVSPYHLYPVQHGGAVRMYNIARQLARRGHDVSVLGFVDTEEQLEAGRHLREFCGEVKLMVRRFPSAPDRLLVPREVREFDQVALHRELDQHLEQRDPDVLQVEYTHMAPYGRRSDRFVSCLTEHDIAFVSAYRHALAKRGVLASAAAYVRYLSIFHLELTALRRFDGVFAVTTRDAQLLRTYLNGSVYVSDRAPTGVDVDAMGAVERRPATDRLLFVGNFAHRPNVDAVEYLAREILPEIHRRAPQMRLVLAGPNPPENIRKLAEDPRVEVLGFVPDLAPFYGTATAVVSPVRIAAGVRVKLLEAFAARVPVVTTGAGAEGIDVDHDSEVLMADKPAAFADQVLRIAKDPMLGQRLAAKARRLVEDRYSWVSIVEALEEDYRLLLRRKRIGRA